MKQTPPHFRCQDASQTAAYWVFSVFDLVERLGLLKARATSAACVAGPSDVVCTVWFAGVEHVRR